MAVQRLVQGQASGNGGRVQDWARALWACAKVAHPLPRKGGARALALSLQADAAGADMASSDATQTGSNMLWALAVLGLLRSPKLEQLVSQLVERANASPVEAFTGEQLAQLAQVDHELRRRRRGRVAPALRLSSDLVQAGLAERTSQSATVSSLHRDVVSVLRGIAERHGVEVEGVEVAELGGLVSVDAVVVLWDGGRRVAVEVDGPSHFMHNVPGHLDGNTQLRNRFLAGVFGEGNAIAVTMNFGRCRNRAEKQAHLARLLGL